MAQKIKVQDGVVVYSTSDPTAPGLSPNPPTGDVDFIINGQLGVSLELAVGNDPLADGTISTPPSTDLNIVPGKDISMQTPSGNIVLNNVIWPTNTPTVGMYMGVSALNTLTFYSLPAPAYQLLISGLGQTVFNTSVSTVANGSGFAHLQVFVNGSKQIEGASKNYQVTGATQITFNVGLALNDNVEFYAFP